MNISTVRKTSERDRRTKHRFPIEREVRYKVFYGLQIAQTGAGNSLNISSRGIWFTTETLLTAGVRVELSMDWPALLNASCPMKLIIYGVVTPSKEQGAAVAIDRYEFRTQGPRTDQPKQLSQVELLAT